MLDPRGALTSVADTAETEVVVAGSATTADVSNTGSPPNNPHGAHTQEPDADEAEAAAAGWREWQRTPFWELARALPARTFPMLQEAMQSVGKQLMEALGSGACSVARRILREVHWRCPGRCVRCWQARVLHCSSPFNAAEGSIITLRCSAPPPPHPRPWRALRHGEA